MGAPYKILKVMFTYKTTPRTSSVKDGLSFNPVGEFAYRAIINTSYGKIEVLYCMPETTDHVHPYEVWYPGKSDPVTFQTAGDIMNYILNH